MPLTLKGQKIADYAKKIASERERGSDVWKKLTSLQCWDGVLICALESGEITESTFNALKNIYANSYSTYISKSDPVVRNRQGMMNVPRGSFLGFIDISDPRNPLIHAMVAIGEGKAAGNKNDCIGIGSMFGWEILDLAHKLRWLEGENCFEAKRGFKPDGSPKLRKIQIRYRKP